MKIRNVIMSIIIILLIVGNTTISYGSGAQASNPNTVLGNGGATTPYAPGQQQIQANEEAASQETDDDDADDDIDEVKGTGTVTKQDTGKHTAGEIVDEGKSFIEIGKQEESVIKGENLQSMSSMIYNILLVVGIIIAVVIGIVLGIKWVTGGIEGQVDVKNMLIPYIVGCVIIFGAFTIWKVVLMTLSGLEK